MGEYAEVVMNYHKRIGVSRRKVSGVRKRRLRSPSSFGNKAESETTHGCNSEPQNIEYRTAEFRRMESLRSVFFKIDRSTQKLTTGRSTKGLTRARIHYFDIRHSLFDIYPPLEDSLFQSLFGDSIGHSAASGCAETRFLQATLSCDLSVSLLVRLNGGTGSMRLAVTIHLLESSSAKYYQL
jgi:hypothetical protein